ncbi:MAG: hypothetical protein JW699_02500, partial [Chitinispirillaceae bacterium]|nr:hypothetical protein [Chitinispirillaceae bacterium]
VVKAGTCRKAFKVLMQCGWSAALDYGGKSGSLDVDSLGKIDWFIGFAADKNTPQRRLSVSVVTVHGRFWTVHSSFLGAEIFRKQFRPLLAGQTAGENGTRPASACGRAGRRTGG